jgi:hypothetical protein
MPVGLPSAVQPPSPTRTLRSCSCSASEALKRSRYLLHLLHDAGKGVESMASMARQLTLGLLMTVCAALAAHAETWDCVYPGYGKDRGAVRMVLELSEGKLIEREAPFGVVYDVVRQNALAIIAVNALAQVEGTAPSIGAETIIIDRKRGNFIQMVGEIGEEPGWSIGRCTRK